MLFGIEFGFIACIIIAIAAIFGNKDAQADVREGIRAFKYMVCPAIFVIAVVVLLC